MTRRRKPGKRDKSVLDTLYPTLDLHGRTAAEAEREAELWLKSRRGAGEPTVRLITGRGLHSIGPAVLPAAIEDLLRRLRGEVVAEYEREPGGGAYRVRLTRDRDPPVELHTVPAVGGKVDPDVMREAIEALAELGIEPTPVLIRAEVQRIVKKRRREAD